MGRSIRRSLILILLFLSNSIFSDTTVVNTGLIHINKQFKGSRFIDKPWLVKLGDDTSYARVDYNDSDWYKFESPLYDSALDATGFTGKAWFRIHLTVDSEYANKPYIFSIYQKGSSEIYFNGKLVKRIGNYGSLKDERRTGDNDPLFFIPVAGEKNVIAIRYENKQYKVTYDGNGDRMGGFRSMIAEPSTFWQSSIITLIGASVFGVGIFSFFFSIGLVHFLLYLFYRIRRSNLLFSIFSFLLSYYFLHIFLTTEVFDNPRTTGILNLIIVLSVPFFSVSLLSVLYSLFYDKTPKQLKYFFIAAVLISIMLLIDADLAAILIAVKVVIISFELMRVMIIAIRKKRKGARIISIGFGSFVVFIATFFSIGLLSKGNLAVSANTSEGMILFILFILAIASIPLSMSIFLAWDFAQTNKSLSKKLVEVEELSEKSIEQEKEKQKILSDQNEKLEMQVTERTKEIHEQKKLIEEKNKDITDSINYAQRIQRSILPTPNEIKDIFQNAFVLFKPRDIVSGDFYQFKKVGNLKFCILADCTGHGVPGALMSMIGSNLLHQIIVERKISEPNKILSELHKEVKSTLRQTSGAQSHDGMDASVVLLKGNKLYMSSANRPVYIIQNGELSEIKPDKRSIGGSQSSDDVEFAVTEIESQPDMMLYLFSDGYADQFGGDTGKKFKVKNLSGLLLAIQEKPLDVQHQILNSTFDSWKNQLEQVDDVCIIGIRL